MNYLAGEKERTLVVRLPVFLSRFIEGVSLEQAAFFERWKIIGGESSRVVSCSLLSFLGCLLGLTHLQQIGKRRIPADILGAPREAQSIFPIKLSSTGDVDLAKHNKVMSGNRFSLLPNIDPNPSNVSGLIFNSNNIRGVCGHLSTTGRHELTCSWSLLECCIPRRQERCECLSHARISQSLPLLDSLVTSWHQPESHHLSSHVIRRLHG
jgi:hypothetical protein